MKISAATLYLASIVALASLTPAPETSSPPNPARRSAKEPTQPERASLDVAPVAVQESFYSVACYVAAMTGDTSPVAAPPLVTPSRAAEIKLAAERLHRSAA